MTGDPRVSVVIPTYQRREYVCRAVRSVLAQRFTDWELIVVDDGSTDGTAEALLAFGARVRYHHQENRGVSAARNAGTDVARGEILAFLDSDDRWLPDHLDTVVGMLDRNPPAVLASTCPRFHFGGRGRPEDARLIDALPLQLVDNWVGYPSATAVRRRDLLAVGGFDERMHVLEDGELWLRLSARGPFALLERRTVVRQATRGSLSEQARRSGRFLAGVEHLARTGQALVAELPRRDRATLAVRATARMRYCQALRGLAEDDEDAVREGLAAACRELPELSADPWFVDWRFKMLATDREQRLAFYQTAALLWPEPSSDTAVFLQLRAALLALRVRRLRLAARMLRSLRFRAVPGLVRRQRRLGAQLLRKRVQSRRYRGRDLLPAR